MASLGYHGLRSLDAADTLFAPAIALLLEEALLWPSALAPWRAVIPENAPNSQISGYLTAGSRGLKPTAQEPSRK